MKILPVIPSEILAHSHMHLFHLSTDSKGVTTKVRKPTCTHLLLILLILLLFIHQKFKFKFRIQIKIGYLYLGHFTSAGASERIIIILFK